MHHHSLSISLLFSHTHSLILPLKRDGSLSLYFLPLTLFLPLSHSLSLSHSMSLSLMISLTHDLSHSLSLSLGPSLVSPTRSLSPPPSHSLFLAPLHSFSLSLSVSLSLCLPDSSSLSLVLSPPPFTHSFDCVSTSFVLSRTHSFVLPLTRNASLSTLSHSHWFVYLTVLTPSLSLTHSVSLFSLTRYPSHSLSDSPPSYAPPLSHIYCCLSHSSPPSIVVALTPTLSY